MVLKKYAKCNIYGLMKGGGRRPNAYIFRKLSSSWCSAVIEMQSCDLPFSWYSRLNDQNLGTKFGILGSLGVPPPKEDTFCP